MQPRQRVISAAVGWRSTVTTLSPPRVSSLTGRTTRTRCTTPPFHPNSPAYFGTSPASNMALVNETNNKQTEAPRHNAWIGSAGAAGYDLRSELS